MRKHSGWFLKLVIVLSVILLLAQLAFQVVLLIMVPYGSIIEKNCQGSEPIFRYIGFIRLNGLSLSQFIIRVSPEFIMFFSSITIQVLCHKINNVKDLVFDKSDPEDSITTDERTNSSFFQRNKYTFLTAIGKYLCLLLLCLAGILRPTVINAIYFLIFLFCVTWWAFNRESKKLFAVLCRFSMLCIFVQLLAVYFYQIPWFQEQIPVDTLLAKLTGLYILVVTDCSDPRVYQISTSEAWPSFALPFVLVTLFYILWFESSLLLSKEYELELQKLEKAKKYKLSGKPGSLHRISTNRWRSATRKVRINSEDDSDESSDISDAAEDIEVHFRPHTSRAIDNEIPTEHTPLIRNHESIRSRSRLRPESAAASHNKDAISDGQRSDIVTEDASDAEEDMSPSMAEYLMDALMTISHFVTRTSYIATNIIMMSWSIMFHSWLTFVLLIWAIILWMLPNQRKIMLRSSPFLVLYAELLLLSQYLYELGFLDLEHLGHDNIKNADKNSPVPVKNILIKTLFTSMFLLTLRQYIEEKREAKKVSAVAGMMAPLQDFVVETHSAMDPGVHTKGSQVMKQVGERIRSFLTKFWIWVVAQILFAIGIMGDRMTIFRIIYMALALVFILTFQLSWHIWRKMMYEFWLTVIIYSMIVLVSVYTYQFDHFKEYWTNIGISPELQLDIGLELFDTTELFVRLLTPTFFVIITCIQLYYFHKDFLAISDIKSRGTSIARDRSRSVASRSRSDAEDSKFSDRTSSAEPHVTDMEQEEDENKDSTPRFNLLKNGLMNLQWRFLWDNIKSMLLQFIELFWLYLELHMIKIILLSVMFLAVFDACALHLVFVLLAVIATVLTRKIQVLIIHIMTIIIAVFLLLKMIYQIQYISHDTWNINCTTREGNLTMYNSAELLGFYKTNSTRKLPTLLKGYICIIIITTLFTVVMIRQKYQRHLKGRPLSRPFNLFPRITYRDADRNLTCFIKYLLNFFFYRFGVEVTLISIVLVVSNRMDIYALIYSVWLIIFVSLKQDTRKTVWLCFIIFMVFLIPLQYTLVVALPPYQCFGFPWCNIDSTLLHNLRVWLFLADESRNTKKVSRVLCDFILLLIASRQAVVFRIEKRHQGLDYVGGSNESIIHLIDEPNFQNPTPDFISSARGWLDIGKRIFVQGFLWLTLAFIFLTGTHRITFFSLGYLIGAFIFLWLGNDLYLRPIRIILKWWDYLILYNVLVILSKTLLQIPACLFIKVMQEKFCWLTQLLEISCINKLQSDFEFKVGPGIGDLKSDAVNYEGLAWDGFTFLLLIIQRRLFNSYYFFHVIDETKAMAILASRGAELIEELSQKQIQEQQETERKILEKIKYKMDRIKASQKRIQGPNYKEPATHYLGNQGAIEAQAPLAHDSSPEISSATSPQGFYTPVEEGTPAATRPNSYLQAPTPTSAIMTVSLDHYLDPQRISFGSPPNSEFHPRRTSFDDSLSVFSPPPSGATISHHRRQSSLGVGPPWLQNHLARSPRCSFSVSSHHTSIRSGDYYMFDDVDEELDLISEGKSESKESFYGEGKPTEPTVSELLTAVMKTDIQKTVAEQEKIRKKTISDTTKERKMWLQRSSSDKASLPSRRHSVPLMSTASPSDSDEKVAWRSLTSLAKCSKSASHDSKPPSGSYNTSPSSEEVFSCSPCDSEMIKSTEPECKIGGIECLAEKKKKSTVDKPDSRSKKPTTFTVTADIERHPQFDEEPQPSTSKGTTSHHRRGPKIFLRKKQKSSPPEPSKDPPDEDETSKSLSSDGDKQTCGQKLILYLKFVWHFINSVMVSLTKWLNKFSRDYRYVIRTLSVEKKLLKEKKNFGIGVRTGKYTMWQPLAIDVVPKSSYSPAQVEELENKREMSAADQPPIVRLILALWFAGISHSELVCYFMIFIHHIESATILSLPLPLMVFLWGTLTVPRPTKTFWVTIIAYTEVMIVIKSVFQLELIPWNQGVVPENLPFYAPRIIGIERQINFATYDLFLLLVVFFHRWMLKSLGLWTSTMDIKKVYDEIDKNDNKPVNLEESKQKSQQTPALLDVPCNTQTFEVATIDTDGKNYALLEAEDKLAKARIIILKHTFADPCMLYPKIIYLSLKKHLSPMKIFFQQLLTSSLRVTADVYTLMFFCDFFNLLVVIFGVASFGSQLGDGGISQYFQENKIPFAFLVMLIIQFGLIIVDRTLYLRKYIFGKIIFQYFLIIGVHVWMFFILPAVTERKFNATLPPQMWYLVKCLYLLLSAYQIRSGYPTRILGNCLCKNYNILNLILFKIFMLIPFVFELRALMDWVWTDTSMSLNDWLTLEDIFAHIFQLKCLRRLEAEYPSPRGAKTSAFTKYLVGGGCLVALIAVIWFPLVLFSLGNTVGEPNLPYEFKMDIRIGSFEPIYSMSAQSGSIVKFTPQDWTKMASVYKKSRAAQNFLSNYDWEDVGVVKLSVNSASLWTISPPGKQSMIEQLTGKDDSVDIKLTWTIQRLSTDPEHPSTVSGKQDVQLDKIMRINITKMLENQEKAVDIPEILPKFIKITGPGSTYPVNQLMMNEDRRENVPEKNYVDITLQLHSWPPDNSTNFSWSASEDCSILPDAIFLNDIPLNSCPNSANATITLYTFNDKAFPATLNLISGKGIIGLYTTFVIVVHTFVRGFFTGISFKIMFDDVPNVDRILQLCLDIYLVRESGELDLEEDLFAKLVFLYRSPETLIKWTRPPEEVPPEEDPEKLPQLSH
nr:PREDICTED: piezo-type mechanosensitive ion channel component isoform X2 [Bemisia tabaci]